MVLHSIDHFLATRLHGCLGQKLLPCGNVLETGRVYFRMDFCFHGGKTGCGLALARFEARVGLVDHVNASLPANHLAVGMAGFERLDG
jgi:hypothetical protein